MEVKDQNLPIIGLCDRCENEIPRRDEERYFVLKISSVKVNVETYSLLCCLCSRCAKQLEKWMFVKENLNGL